MRFKARRLLKFAQRFPTHQHTGPENQPGLGPKVSSRLQEEFQRIFGFSENRAATLKRLVCALETPYQALN